MRTADVAEKMGMRPRTYELFEAGKGKVHHERIHRFARVTDSDPYAIFTAMAFGSPEFALRAADNKLVEILVVALHALDEDMGDGISELDGRTIINTVTRAFKELALQAVRRDEAANAWLKQRLEKLIPPDLADDESTTEDEAP
ncbi:XRE family transcriptional regulator [Brevundimonas pondensis]|uniref:XRE family transcriptional regulator n=2 Tax=Brevundimonas pondensis TaxID=2774189 RepID=A0ABX7SRL4_9CAUL|nr:XRE family transcriptional regulator [Brevundimonas pondensis]